MELVKKDNARVVICNTPEAKMFAELIPNIDKLYKYLRNNVGSKNVELEYFDEKRRDILYFAEKINSKFHDIRERRKYYENHPEEVEEIIKKGTAKSKTPRLRGIVRANNADCVYRKIKGAYKRPAGNTIKGR